MYRQYGVLGALMVVTAVIFYFSLRTTEEEPRRYKVPPPRWPEGDKTVDETSIKVTSLAGER